MDVLTTDDVLANEIRLLRNVRTEIAAKLDRRRNYEMIMKMRVLGDDINQIRQDQRDFLVIMEEAHEKIKRKEKEYVDHLLRVNERVVDESLEYRFYFLEQTENAIKHWYFGKRLVEVVQKYMPRLTEENYEDRVKFAALLEADSKKKYDKLMEEIREKAEQDRSDIVILYRLEASYYSMYISLSYCAEMERFGYWPEVEW